MSLARTLMNGVVEENSTLINAARYGHSDGASVIAMESVAELHEIFMEEYNYEQADLAALSEGVALEGSQYEAIAEAATKGAFQKIKDFFAKLWEKVKAFFHNVVRFIDAIFKSGAEFVKKYDKDIKAIKEVKDLTVTMHKFDDEYIDLIGNVEERASEVTEIVDTFTGKVMGVLRQGSDVMDKDIDELKQKYSAETLCRNASDNKADSIEELRQYYMNLFIGEEAEEMTLSASDIQKFADTLAKSGKVAKFKTVENKLAKGYTAAKKMIDDADADIQKSEDGFKRAQVSKQLSAMSAGVSVMQNIINTEINCAKAAFKRRDAEYKHAIMAAFRKSVKA